MKTSSTSRQWDGLARSSSSSFRTACYRFIVSQLGKDRPFLSVSFCLAYRVSEDWSCELWAELALSLACRLGDNEEEHFHAGWIIGACNKRPAHLLLLLLTPAVLSSSCPILTGALLQLWAFSWGVSLEFSCFIRWRRVTRFRSSFFQSGSGAKRCRYSTESLLPDRNLRLIFDRTKKCFSVKSLMKSSGPMSK